ncbi:hypothetical protein DIZ81_12020 [Legionella taurinensis]|uniref:Type IV secretion protein Dot n=1 Tax=Legionella taurinensis TaxID=70611 RepID=A0AB38N473_9GAMM|nr:hypothetical protein [Legionella taurinensis]MDX1838467.1 hypothetical protein [Legionella taurinensis]PUT38910.1 hypothetical protein DB744_12030 [Legionella taurinensis]PUT40971.1 hypothetical protein DB746_10425 [Legionella taurinensis]PUT43203.1 hypothetical protein DB743_11425 [Legionella taurinensis]PUT46389.1 hypothetical protein DB745_10910 [Legionella taurinensis]
MSNIQIHLVFKKPRFFTSEPILEQLKAFAELGFSVPLQKLFIGDPIKGLPALGFKGERHLQFLSQLITELEALQAIEKIDTKKARSDYSVFAHYLRVRKGYKETVQNQLGKEFQLLTEEELNQENSLLQNVTTRAQLFKEKVLALRDSELLQKAMLYAQRAGEVYQQALLVLQTIDETAQQALMKNEPVEKDIQFIQEKIRAIDALSAAFDKLGLQNELDSCHDAETKNKLTELVKLIQEEKAKVIATGELAKQALSKVVNHNEYLNRKNAVVEEKPITPTEVIVEPEVVEDPLTSPAANNPTDVPDVDQRQETVPQENVPAPEQEDESVLRHRETLKQQLGILMTLVSNYKTQLESEKKDFVTRFFHQSRKDTKIAYCTQLLASFEKTAITPDSSLQTIVTQAHDQAITKVGSSALLTAGGSYFGTSRLLAVQRLLGIEDAWKKGKSRFIATTRSDFHGLKTTGIVENVRAIVSDFFAGRQDVSKFKDLCEKVAPSSPSTANSKTTV